jgi:hypothetical protein
MPTSHTAYSRDEAVSALTSYYEFLVKLYLPPHVLKYPPPEGWPISEGYLDQPKNDAVLDLLRHIPYIGDDGSEYVIYENSICVDYTSFTGEGPHDADLLRFEQTTLPSHVATIAMVPRKGRNGYWFFLDTERGTMTMCDFVDGEQQRELTEVFFFFFIHRADDARRS